MAYTITKTYFFFKNTNILLSNIYIYNSRSGFVSRNAMLNTLLTAWRHMSEQSMW
jgi:hypothetical protein